MNLESQVLALFEEGNPVPEPEALEPVDVAAYLAILEQRSSKVTQLDTRPTKEKSPKGRQLALILSAAAAVILIGAVLIIDLNEDPPPASVPTPTTVAQVTPTTLPEALDPSVEEGLAVATSFIEALLVGDLETARSAALDSVPLMLVDGGDTPDTGPRGELPWKEALGWEAVLDGCVLSTPDPVSTRVACSVTNSTDISRALGVAPYTSIHQYTVMHEGGSYFGQSIKESTVVSSGGDADTWEKIGYVEFKAQVFNPFLTWLEANHKEDLEQVMWHAFSIGVFSPDRWMTGDFGPSHTPESIELWRQYSEEYVAGLSG